MDRLSRKWEIDRERERGREAKGEKQKRTRATQNKLCLWWMLRSEIETSSFSHPLLPYYLFSSPLCPSVFPPHLTHLCLYVSLYLSASLSLFLSLSVSLTWCAICVINGVHSFQEILPWWIFLCCAVSVKYFLLFLPFILKNIKGGNLLCKIRCFFFFMHFTWWILESFLSQKCRQVNLFACCNITTLKWVFCQDAQNSHEKYPCK